MAKSKREIDKEIMFNKIMPSGIIGKELEGDSLVQEQKIPRPENPVHTPEPKPNIFPNDSGLQFKDKEPTMVVNIMEKLVLEKLDAAFSKFNCCKCDRCKKDVAAIALNKLKPKYVVTEQNRILSYTANQPGADVTTALVQAIITVKANPRH